MKTIAANLEKAYPKSNFHVGATVEPLLENQVGEYRASLTLLFVAVGVVLAHRLRQSRESARGARRGAGAGVCGSARPSARRVGKSLGNFSVESLVLGLVGGVVGLFLAAWSRDLLVALAPAGNLDFRALARRLGAGLHRIASPSRRSLLFGLWPAWHYFADRPSTRA